MFSGFLAMRFQLGSFARGGRVLAESLRNLLACSQDALCSLLR